MTNTAATTTGTSTSTSKTTKTNTKQQPIKRSVAFHNRIKELKQFKSLHDHTRVPFQWKHNPSLAMWCDNMRRQYKLYQEDKKSSMTKERIEILEEIGFWWGTKGKSFEERIEELNTYKDLHGGSVTVNKIVNQSLYDWCAYQKIQYQLKYANQTSNLSDERENMLIDMGFQFGKRKRKRWDDFYQDLCKYKEEKGHVVVHEYDASQKGLFEWVENQRARWRRRKELILTDNSFSIESPMLLNGNRSCMTEEHYQLLINIGFTFDTWDTQYEALKSSRDDQDCSGSTCMLNTWISAQRVEYKKWCTDESTSELTNDRILKLCKIGFVFADDTRTPLAWKERVNELKAFKKLHGHCSVPKNFPLNKRLGLWVHHTRDSQWHRLQQESKDGEDESDAVLVHLDAGLTEERIQQLKKLGFVFK